MILLEGLEDYASGAEARFHSVELVPGINPRPTGSNLGLPDQTSVYRINPRPIGSIPGLPDQFLAYRINSWPTARLSTSHLESHILHGATDRSVTECNM
jgi:hypothetical protein